MKTFCIVFTLHRYVLKYKWTTQFTVVFENFCHCNVVASDVSDGKVNKKLLSYFFPNGHIREMSMERGR